MDSNTGKRHAKIVCTLGPATSSPRVIEKMLRAGMNVVRLNLNYNTLEEHSKVIKRVRSLGQKLDLPVGILLDLPGLKRGKGSVKEVFGKHLEFADKEKVDFVALSFIYNVKQVQEVKRLLERIEADIPVIVKIENAQALAESGALIEEAAGVMVARGDLALDISFEKVPIAQKRLIAEANLRGKPVITATEMLESMVRSPTPTRAEATDVANAVLDGTDALMLSEETAIGKYPVEATSTMVKIIQETEGIYPYEDTLLRRWQGVLPVDDAAARSACQIASQVCAKAIVAFTTGGTTALRVSKYRPQQPILALTPSEVVVNRLALSWGVMPIKQQPPANLEQVFELGGEAAIEAGLASKGDLVVITAGLPLQIAGSTNLLKVHCIG